MLIEANNTLDGFEKAKEYLQSLEPPLDTELEKESPLLIIFKNLDSDETVCRYNGKKFQPQINYQELIHEEGDFVRNSFGHYEELLNNEIKEIIVYLKENPFSKRAVIDAWTKEQRDLNKKAKCLVYLLFRQTNNGLDLHIHMRANDANNKALLNFHTFAAIHRYVASELGLKTGSYYHYADSYHILK